MMDTPQYAPGRRFPDHFLDALRQRIHLHSVIEAQVDWDRRKSQPAKGIYWACCPFHGEKTASFRVDDERGRYHCFGCSRGGDIFTWLMEKEGNSFFESVKVCAERAGLPLPQLTPEQEAAALRRATAFDINAKAADFYRAQLLGPSADAARAYLKKRGLSAEETKIFGLGFAPKGADGCCRHLLAKGYSHQDLLSAGIAREGKEREQVLDRFFGRIIFPIRDRQGRVAGFGGRAIDAEAEPKYLNSADGPTFDKGGLLFNFDRAFDAARETGDLIIVEGFFDVFAIERAGLPQVVAPMGTSVTEEQLALAWRVAAEPCLCLDGDEAGRKAGRRLIDLALPLLRPGKSLCFVSLEAGRDPDELLQAHGLEALATALSKRTPLNVALWEALTSEADISTPERLAQFREVISGTVARITEPGIKAAYEGELEARFKAFVKSKGLRSPGPLFPRKSASGTRGQDADRAGTAGGRPPRQTDSLIGLVEAANAELFLDMDGEPHASFNVDGHFETWPIRSREFNRWLAGLYYDATEGAIGGQAREDALRVLEAKAVKSKIRHEIFRRIGQSDGRTYLDLCDERWRAVEITGSGWRVVERPGCKFTRGAAMRALPEPEAGGMIEELGNHFNCRDERDLQLITGWIVGAFRPTGPYAILLFVDEQGSGKSFACRVLQHLIDPNGSPLRSLADNEKDVNVSAWNRWVSVFDNLSHIPENASDWLCRIATGGGVSYRALYSDREESFLQVQRPIVLNGISELTQRPDLASRATRIAMKVIGEAERRAEADLWEELEHARPRLLGAVLDAVSCALKNFASIKLDRLPRMADFCRWVTAAEPALGWEPGTFLKAYEASAGELNTSIAEDDLVVSALKKFFAARGGAPFQGSASTLLEELREMVDDRTAKSPRWPSSPMKMGNKLTRIAGVLRSQGFECAQHRGTSRAWFISPPVMTPTEDP